MKPKSKPSRATRQRLAFYVTRARMGGVARSRLHSPLWRSLCTQFLNERRLGKTPIPTFKEWLTARGFDGLK
jgi:hypothetical protein